MLTNYTNRSVDYLLYQGVEEKGMNQLNTVLLRKGGAVCSGLQKLVQRWLLTLMIPKGSMMFNKERGTTFMDDILYAKSESDVNTAFLLNNSEAASQLRADETDDMPEDEKFGKAKLRNISVSNNRIALNVELYSKDGNSAQVIMPINANPIML